MDTGAFTRIPFAMAEADSGPTSQTRRTSGRAHSVRARMVLAFAPAVIAVVLAIVVVDSVLRLQRTSALVAQTHELITRGYALLSTLQDAETGQRGYVITGEERYLEPYNSATRR